MLDDCRVVRWPCYLHAVLSSGRVTCMPRGPLAVLSACRVVRWPCYLLAAWSAGRVTYLPRDPLAVLQFLSAAWSAGRVTQGIYNNRYTYQSCRNVFLRENLGSGQ